MNAWARWRIAALGVVLIVATNAVALIGVAYNRSGEPESVLTLSQREIGRIGEWGFGGESSGIELALRWRMPGRVFSDFYYGDEAREDDRPPWIDQAGLAALGFDIPNMEDADRRRRLIEHLSSRDALAVLELDGPAYRREVEHVRQRADEARARAAAMPNDADLKRRADGAKNHLGRMEREETRLYVVDAGSDLAALRAKYPDNTRYAIVRAEIRPMLYERKGKSRLSAYVNLTTANIMAPLAYRDALERSGGADAKSVLTEVRVAFGKRLEPWIVTSVSRPGKAP